MKIRKLLVIVFVVISVTNLHAWQETLCVPGDFCTIQEAIDNARDGDIILVYPGEYVENIRFHKKAITVTSLIHITENPAYIDSTVINGNYRGHVVTDFSESQGSSVLRGFTICNGVAHYGGGIFIDGAPKLQDLLIRNNQARQGGGGICCSEGVVDIERVTLVDNTSQMGGGINIIQGSVGRIVETCLYSNRAQIGGGIAISEYGNLSLQYVTFINNQSGCYGGGFAATGGRGVCELRNVLFANNSANSSGGAFCLLSNFLIEDEENFQNIATLQNSIVIGNSTPEIALTSEDDEENQNGYQLDVLYCDIPDGEEAVEITGQGNLEWGEGNINEDPCFRNPHDLDFTLAENSPCIDAGRPGNSDPDGSRADIGSKPFPQFGFLFGNIRDAETDDPVTGARIFTPYGAAAISDDYGYWEIRNARTGLFDITASGSVYNSLTFENRFVESFDTLEINFDLIHPVLNINPGQVEYSLYPDEIGSVIMNLENNSPGILEWEAEAYLEYVDEEYELYNSIPLTELFESTEFSGITFVHGNFYVTCNDNDSKSIFVLDSDGRLIDSFPQPGNERFPMHNLTWDGECLVGAKDHTLIRFTTEGETVDSWEIDTDNPALAWNEERQLLIVGLRPHIYLDTYNRAGERIGERNRIDTDLYTPYLCDIAYMPNDPDDKSLYLSIFNSQALEHLVFKCSEFDRIAGQVFLANPDEDVYNPKGICLTNELVHPYWSFVSVGSREIEHGGDMLNMWFFNIPSNWMELDCASGSIVSFDYHDFIVFFNTENMEPGLYEGSIYIHNNSTVEPLEIPVSLRVGNLAVSDNLRTQPVSPGLISIFPNPFNSTTTISYSLPMASQVSLKVFDLSGREVKSMVEGVVEAGQHSIVLDSRDLSSGLYFAEFRSGSNVQTCKLVSLK